MSIYDAAADDVTCNWDPARKITTTKETVKAFQGQDETAQSLTLDIWGVELKEISCEQLDSDPDEEVVIVSRNEGTGPYYRLQIVDFRANGILTWSYWSEGRPKVENGQVLLGTLENGYTGAGSTSTYATYIYNEAGLVPE